MILNECKSEKYDIIILAGQSNAQGSGIGDVLEEYIPDERIHMLSDNSNPSFKEDANGKAYLDIKFPCEQFIEVAKERVENDKKHGNFALTFAKKYIEQGYLEKDRKILIVHSAVGGTGFYRNEWGVDNVLFNRLISMTDNALKLNEENRIVAYLWHQGEHDAEEPKTWTSEEKYRRHYYNLRYQTELYYNKYNITVPFITAGFCEDYRSKNQEICAPVLQAIQDFVIDFNGEYIDTSDLLSNRQTVDNGDVYHFSRPSLYILGERYFDAYKKLINK